jgi:hypothetical protein
MKIFLVKGERRDGEHEEYVHCLVKAESDEQLESLLPEIFKKEDEGEFALDHRGAYFGFGDSLTLTKYESHTAITKEQADWVARLGLAHYWN